MTSRLRIALPLLLMAGVLTFVAVAATPPAQAGPLTITVTLADDLGNGGGNNDCFSEGCTLKEAIELANATPGHDQIVFDPQNAPYTIIPLDEGLPIVDATDGITIDGAGGNVGIYGYEQSAGSGLVFHSQLGEPIHDLLLSDILVDSFQDRAVVICASPGNACTQDVSGVEIEDVSSNLNGLGGLFIAGQAIEDVTVKNFDVTDSPSDSAWGIRIHADLTLSKITVQDSALANLGNVGIEAIAFDGSADDVHVLNNELSNMYVGIAVHGDNGSTGFDVQDNTLTTIESGAGISLTGSPLIGPTVRNNTITGAGSSLAALFMQGNVVDAVVEGNAIEGGHDGIFLNGDFINAAGNVVRNNTVSGALHDGIEIGAGQTLISRNNTFGNGELGIDLPSDTDVDPPGVTPNDPGDADEFNDNPLLNFPELTGADDVGITGTACAGCLVELFLSDSDPSGYGEGKDYITSATANGSGEFTVPICGLALAGAAFTATSTFDGNTSEFSETIFLVEPIGECPATPTPTASPPTPSDTPVPSETPSTTALPSVTATPGAAIVPGDLDCSSSVDYLDALIILLFLEDLPFDQETPCPGLTDLSGDFQLADVNCDGVIDEQDAVAILAYFAGVPIAPAVSCPPLGEPV